ncbi:hypothetical protein K443DRAFT_677329 [Laccaria amethystina LaAM-08-1]|uniref:Uncharacterized protein n=1 Tax=Laccaria amethystina LaAM-08-1 TaxID=1095629 RepID=A0A0C9XYF1_9AGAR|nr:hypothetical protein K443DRAFT_677329 [Laccaria amethystina LaAM-08-1]
MPNLGSVLYSCELLYGFCIWSNSCCVTVTQRECLPPGTIVLSSRCGKAYPGRKRKKGK